MVNRYWYTSLLMHSHWFILESRFWTVSPKSSQHSRQPGSRSGPPTHSIWCIRTMKPYVPLKGWALLSWHIWAFLWIRIQDWNDRMSMSSMLKGCWMDSPKRRIQRVGTLWQWSQHLNPLYLKTNSLHGFACPTNHCYPGRSRNAMMWAPRNDAVYTEPQP